MVQVNVNQTDPTKGSGDWLSAECDAIIIIDDYKSADGGENPHCLISMTVHTTTVPDQKGKKIKDERFAFTKAVNRLMEFACAVGAYSRPQWEKDLESGTNPDLPLENCVGMMFATPIRHRKWDDVKDATYWKEQLQLAEQAGDQKKVDRCKSILEKKQGQLQIGGPSGFTFWAIGDADADHIPLPAEDLAMFPTGLPTKMGTLRKRGGPSAGPQLPAKRPTASAGGNGNGGGAVGHRQTQAAPAAAGADLGSEFV